MRLFPSLRYSHPNFFFIYAATGLFHLAMAITYLTVPERFDADALQPVSDFASPEVWGLAFSVAWVLLVLGVYARWPLARAALALGMAICVLRGWLIETSGVNPGAGLIVWGYLAAQHFAMVGEPPVNPVTATE